MHEQGDAILSWHKAAGVICQGLAPAAPSMASYRPLVVVGGYFIPACKFTHLLFEFGFKSPCKHPLEEEVITIPQCANTSSQVKASAFTEILWGLLQLSVHMNLNFAFEPFGIKSRTIHSYFALHSIFILLFYPLDLF